MSSLNKIINKKACFDLQFRRDVKHKRLNKPVYYSWKAQFVIMGKYQDEDLLREVRSVLNCGRLHFVGENKIRYSVQGIDDLYRKVVPFLEKSLLPKNKKRDFQQWSKAIEIIFQNKGKAIHPIKSGQSGLKIFNPAKKWKKEDFFQLIEAQKAMQKYKTKKAKNSKWLSVAETIFEQ